MQQKNYTLKINTIKYIILLIASMAAIFFLSWIINPLAIEGLIQATAYWLIAVLVVFSAFLGMLAYFQIAERRERLLSIRAERKRAETLTIVTARHNEQIFIKDADPARIWQPLHLSANSHINGQNEPPTPLEQANWQAFHVQKKQPARLPEPTDEASNGNQLNPILPVLVACQRAIIAGASNTGKTTLLQHLIAARSQTSKIILIDPHGQRPKYGELIDAKGCGMNWQEIDQTLNAIDWLMVKRYKEIEAGAKHRSHPPVTLIIDELMAIMDIGQRGEAAKKAAIVIKRLATQARKAAIDVVLVAHSLRVSQTGLKGANDLLSNFTVVELHKEQSGQRRCYLHVSQPDSKKELIEHSLPGAYSQTDALLPEAILCLPEPPTPEEMKIIQAIGKGGSLAQISRNAGISVCGSNNKRIKAIAAFRGLILA